MSQDSQTSKAHEDESYLHEIIANSVKSISSEEEVSSESDETQTEESKKENEEASSENVEQVDQESTEEQENQSEQDGKQNEYSTTEVFDSSKFLELSSGGVIKNEEEFKSTLKRLEELNSEVEKLKTEKENIFANSKIKTLNELYKAGKTEEQINEFLRLSELDVNSLEPKEILVQGLIDKGVKRIVAEKMISDQYNLDDYQDPESLTESEKISYEAVLEKMRLDAEPVSKMIAEKLSEISSPELKEGKEVLEMAAKESYKKSLEPFANLLTAQFPKKIEYEANGQKLSYDVPQDEIASIKEEAMEFFFDREVNEKSVAEFIEAKKWMMFRVNGKKILADIAAQHDAAGYKRAKQEFENKSGLHAEERQPIVSSTKDAEAYAMEEANS